MNDRLNELLKKNGNIFGILCRDPRMTDLELLAKAGYHILWLDSEHAPYNPEEIVKMCRTITHLGMIPMVRIVEMIRTHVQILLDGGAQALLLPNIRDADQARTMVRLSKFPPLGARGLASSAPALGYVLGSDWKSAIEEANTATHIMVQVESDQGLNNLESICRVEGIDIVTTGPADWAVEEGILGPDRPGIMAEKEDQVLRIAKQTGKITAVTVTDSGKAKHYLDLGAQLFFTGLDVHMKRIAYTSALTSLQKQLGV